MSRGTAKKHQDAARHIKIKGRGQAVLPHGTSS